VACGEGVLRLVRGRLGGAPAGLGELGELPRVQPRVRARGVAVSAVVLSAEEREAADVLVSASRRELLDALTYLPGYQRAAVRWLAHVIREHRIPAEPPPERPTRPGR
jgi:hypothetical protein